MIVQVIKAEACLIDYTGTQSPITGTSNPERRWWGLTARQAADSITGVLRQLEPQQNIRLAQQAVSARLYGNMTPFGSLGLTSLLRSSAGPWNRDRVSFNVVSSAIDSIVAKIAKSKPSPYYVSSGGDYKAQRACKNLNKLLTGLFFENKAHDLGASIFRDACVFGDGVVKVCAANGRVRYERVLSAELYVDELEGQYGEPRQLHQVKYVDRAVLRDAFPDHTKAIQAAQCPIIAGAPVSTVGDLLMVRESWHLPSGPDATDGKHIITIDGEPLTPLEPWARDSFPFARFRWSPRLLGYWSEGLSARLQSIQIQINKLLWNIQRSFELGAAFKVFIDAGSKIVTEHLTNQIGGIVKYTGSPPQYVTPPTVSPEVFQHLQFLIQRAYDQAGISQLSAVSQKPAGLNSGRALREFNDIESDRFGTISRAYEAFYMDLARLSLDTVKEIAEEGGFRVNVPSRKFLSSVDWKDIDLDEEEFVLQGSVISSLPTEPAGRLQTIQEMMQAGLLSPEQGRRALDFPDLEAIEGLQNSQIDYLTTILEKMVDEGIATPPEPQDNLQLARELALEFYARARSENVPEDRLDLLRTFLTQIGQIEQASQPPQLPPGAGPGAPGPGASPGAPVPQANPVAPPTSDLIQNAPGIPGLQ